MGAGKPAALSVVDLGVVGIFRGRDAVRETEDGPDRVARRQPLGVAFAMLPHGPGELVEGGQLQILPAPRRGGVRQRAHSGRPAEVAAEIDQRSDRSADGDTAARERGRAPTVEPWGRAREDERYD